MNYSSLVYFDYIEREDTVWTMPNAEKESFFGYAVADFTPRVKQVPFKVRR
ncbi:MAG TPA: hypothetical protein VEC08_03830 [Nitrososphaerales archaeon]|nr:hypothetical protein [Nitrososphaerales archaeon]